MRGEKSRGSGGGFGVLRGRKGGGRGDQTGRPRGIGRTGWGRQQGRNNLTHGATPRLYRFPHSAPPSPSASSRQDVFFRLHSNGPRLIMRIILFLNWSSPMLANVVCTLCGHRFIVPELPVGRPIVCPTSQTRLIAC